MTDRKTFLLRIPPDLWEELQRWAADELRSVNSQIEYLLRRAVAQRRRGREGPPLDSPRTTLTPE
ncbi:MAG: Arc family DNA-binding protein [Acidobacteriota bacterium]